MRLKRKKWESKSEIYINCDICGKRILFTRRNRQRCTSGKNGIRTECQKEAQRRFSRGEIRTERRKISKVDTSIKPCLKCGEGFERKSEFNRLCDACVEENDHYKMAYV